MTAHHAPRIEDCIDRTRARLLERAGHENAAFEVYENDRYRWLQNPDGTLQSVMDLRSPERLVLPYTAAMMACLLFIEVPRSVIMLGLGGASQARFLRHQFVDARITAWESDPDIIDIAQRHFCVPGEDALIRIVNDDARTGIPANGPPADLILIDLFDAGGQPQWLRDGTLYTGCRQRLARHGVLAANLWVDPDDELLEIMDGVQRAFDSSTLLLCVPAYRNVVVLAFNATPRLDFAYLDARAAELGRRTGLAFTGFIDRMRESNSSDATGFVL